MITNLLSNMAKYALDTVQKDTIILLNEEPLYAFLQVDSRIEITRKGIDVAAVSMQNGDFVLYINPEGYLSYPQVERLFILKHEWTHWIDEHPLLNSLYITRIWNLACDISINQDLSAPYCRRPKDAQMPEMYGLPPHLTPEQYYVLLLERERQNKLKIHKSFTSVAIGDKLSSSQRQDNKPFSIKGPLTKLAKLSNGIFLVRVSLKPVIFSSDESFLDKKGESITFADLKETDYAEAIAIHEEGGYLGIALRLIDKPNESENERNSEGEEGDTSSQEIENSPNGDTEISLDELDNLHPTWKEMDKNSPNMNKHNLDDKIQEAVKSAGDLLPKGLEAKLKRFKHSTTNWKGELKIFIGSHRGQRKMYTYRKRNKRIPYAPGVKKAPRLKIVIVIDTSASVSEMQLEMFDAEIRKIAASNKDIEIIIIICDVQVRDIYKYNYRLNQSTITFSGRGGTEFKPALEMITKREHALLRTRPDAVLYLTDGGGVAPDTFSIPTLWVLTPDGHKPFAKSFNSGEYINWGRTIQLKE